MVKIGKLVLIPTIFSILVGFSREGEVNEDSYPLEEDYVGFKKPKETFFEKIFNKKVSKLVNLPKKFPQKILDIIPFYGEDFKVSPSDLHENDRKSVSEVYQAPVKVPAIRFTFIKTSL